MLNSIHITHHLNFWFCYFTTKKVDYLNLKPTFADANAKFISAIKPNELVTALIIIPKIRY